MRRCVAWVAAAVAAALMPYAARGADLHLGSIAIPSTPVAPAIDGDLTDPAWQHAVVTHLAYDLRSHTGAPQDTTVLAMTDGAYLYVGVRAAQRETVRATEHTNGVGLDTDDEFQVDLWPNGTSGFRYKFTSTPIGTHYQYSTENNSFEPEWLTAGRVVPGGYTITMRIPLAVMHGTGAAQWRVQFIRYVAVADDVFVWSYGDSQRDFNDVNYSGALAGLPRMSALRPKSRIGLYGLGQAGSAAGGGNRVATGADLSIPLIEGASLVGTIYPDYSNVEIDQQTIAPTAFARFYQDVRPFFTQGAEFYSYPNGICENCPGIVEFYTPAIPTPRDGFAIEGQRGLFGFGALNAASIGRTDTAEALDFVAPNQKNAIDFQGTEVNAPGLRDDTDGVTFTHDNLRDLQVFARYAHDAGTNVLAGDMASRYEFGSEWYNPSGARLDWAIRKVGAYFVPVDGLVQQPDIAGYDVSGDAPYNFATTARFTRFELGGDINRYHDVSGALDRAETGLFASLTTRTLFNLQASMGSSYVRIASTVAPAYQPGVFTPVNQQGAQFGYNLNGQTPSFVAYDWGHFGPGVLGSWTRSVTLRAGPRGTLTFDADDTRQAAYSGLGLTQWLERASFAYQPASDRSLAVGIRRIIGTPPMLLAGFAPPAVDAWNLSAAFHKKIPGGELYVVYGDASAFSTSPRFIVKYIAYIGADKGT